MGNQKELNRSILPILSLTDFSEVLPEKIHMLNKKNPTDNPASLFLFGVPGEAVASAIMHHTISADFDFLFTNPHSP